VIRKFSFIFITSPAFYVSVRRHCFAFYIYRHCDGDRKTLEPTIHL